MIICTLLFFSFLQVFQGPDSGFQKLKKDVLEVLKKKLFPPGIRHAVIETIVPNSFQARGPVQSFGESRLILFETEIDDEDVALKRHVLLPKVLQSQ